MKFTVIDLGTNTFHLLIVEADEKLKFVQLYEEKQAARIGQGGISNGLITEEAFERGIDIVKYYQAVIEKEGIHEDCIFATGTSAIRSAKNGEDFVRKILSETGIKVEVISGEREAELIYNGVKAAVSIGNETSLIMDIGGGSVEFIICNQNKVFWKQSFEIGGQRLMDKFMPSDPIPPYNIQKLYDFLEEKLLPLTNAIHQYAPKILIGSAGTFDTLVEMNELKQDSKFDLSLNTSYQLPLDDFQTIFQEMVVKNREERLAIPGMIPLRVDMIVVACCLLTFVVKKYTILEIKTSTYALKEGVLIDKIKRLNPI